MAKLHSSGGEKEKTNSCLQGPIFNMIKQLATGREALQLSTSEISSICSHHPRRGEEGKYKRSDFYSVCLSSQRRKENRSPGEHDHRVCVLVVLVGGEGEPRRAGAADLNQGQTKSWVAVVVVVDNFVSKTGVEKCLATPLFFL